MGHWYRLTDGAPVHELPSKSKPGQMRPTTLRDARKLGLVPSVTGIIDVMDKPALRAWQVNQVLMAALTAPPKEVHQTETDWIRSIRDEARSESERAMNIGNAMHQALEDFVNGRQVVADHHWLLDAVQDALGDKRIDMMTMEPERTFANLAGFGGMVDLSGKDLDGVPVIIDYKSKDFDDESKKLHYLDQAIQLAAYANGIGFPLHEVRGINVYMSRTTPLVRLHEWRTAELRKGWSIFHHALRIWQIERDFLVRSVPCDT